LIYNLPTFNSEGNLMFATRFLPIALPAALCFLPESGSAPGPPGAEKDAITNLANETAVSAAISLKDITYGFQRANMETHG
jgi:hypothetical protein